MGPAARRGAAALAAVLAALGLALASSGTGAQGRPGVASLDVVDEKGDTLPIAREVIITREGVHIDRVGSGRPGAEREPVEVEIDEGREPRVHVSSGGGTGEIVSIFDSVEIPGDRVVRGEVVTVFGDIRVEGEVQGDVVAVLGSIELGDSARVGGDVVAIGGVEASPSAVILGDTVSIPLVGFPMFQPWAIWSGFLLTLTVAAFLGMLIALLFPDRLRRVAQTASERSFLSLLLGFASVPLVLIVGCLLTLTLIGIPIAVLLWFLYPLAGLVGGVAGAALLGSRLRGTGLADTPMWLSALMGILFIAVFGLAGVVMMALAGEGGGVLRAIGLGIAGVSLVLSGVTVMIGLGALLLSRLGESRRPSPPVPEPSAGPPAAAPGLPGPPTPSSSSPPPASSG